MLDQLDQQTTIFILSVVGGGVLLLIGALLEHMGRVATEERNKQEQTGEFGTDYRLTGEQLAITEHQLNTHRYMNTNNK